MIDGVAPLMPMVKAGRINAVAITTDHTLPGLEGVPLVKDALPGPKGMPADLMAHINHDLNAALAEPEVARKMQNVSLFANPRSPADSLAFNQAEIDRWASVLKKAGIEPS